MDKPGQAMTIGARRAGLGCRRWRKNAPDKEDSIQHRTARRRMVVAFHHLDLATRCSRSSIVVNRPLVGGVPRSVTLDGFPSELAIERPGGQPERIFVPVPAIAKRERRDV